MSWDSYLDNLIAQSKDASSAAHIDKACIIGLDGGAPWTTSAHGNALKASQDEMTAVASAMKSNPTSFAASGIKIEGVKYMFLRAEGNLALGKKKGEGAVTLQKSKSAVVIAHCPEGCQQGNANKAVNVIAEYLESLNM